MIDKPTSAQIPQLLQLWKDVFGEYEGFWDGFLETGFSPERCRCTTEDGQITAALCWLDASLGAEKLAYLYAVVTHPSHRGKGLCRRLMADTHNCLQDMGYDAALLVPAEASLRRMYEKLGYETCTTVTEFTAPAGAKKEPLRRLGPEEYAKLRRVFLPEGGILQEGPSLALLARDAQFYAGEDLLMAAYADGETLHVPELLGNSQKAPAIVAALNCIQGNFRIPGKNKDFAMFHPLKEEAGKPSYFGFAFD